MNNDAYNNLTLRQRAYVDAIRQYGDDLGIDTTKEEYNRAELRGVSMEMKGTIWIPNWITHDQSRRSDRGVFRIPEVPVGAVVEEEAVVEAVVIEEEPVLVTV